MIPALLALLAAATPAPGAFTVDPAGSVVRFHLDHKMHKVDGRSTQVEGKAIVGDDGKVMTMVRIPAASFDTGDGNRDSHMRETLEISKYPFVVFKGVTSLTVPVSQGKPVETKLQGELDFHGVKRPLEVPVQISFGPDGATVKTKFAVSLEAHRIERPSLLFVKVDDQLLMDVELRLAAAPR
jgi:polyisoprenoid-binding protein YceI